MKKGHPTTRPRLAKLKPGPAPFPPHAGQNIAEQQTRNAVLRLRRPVHRRHRSGPRPQRGPHQAEDRRLLRLPRRGGDRPRGEAASAACARRSSRTTAGASRGTSAGRKRRAEGPPPAAASAAAAQGGPGANSAGGGTNRAPAAAEKAGAAGSANGAPAAKAALAKRKKPPGGSGSQPCIALSVILRNFVCLKRHFFVSAPQRLHISLERFLYANENTPVLSSGQNEKNGLRVLPGFPP
ncbi:MAG: hypothetical protein BJ554DRAFT_5297 [Olpidium bornovanus]|uniref:Uncharacterized protein n=1 Tax=Olpidium bornovanus TaxID=278681 RepID=A0A8H7ZZW1_9FUNG|nr:MAG: hypothetical protein BJ554DRAFT_5297 [Olpidium bornovanus]